MTGHQTKKSVTFAILVSALAIASCSNGALPNEEPASSGEEWRQPPVMTEARWQGDTVALLGVAERFGRVVLADASTYSYAANSDSEGQFSIEVAVPNQGLELKPRIQSGQEFAEGRGLVFLRPGDLRIAAVLMDGDASYRLSDQQPLDAVDTDGSMMIVSGRAAPDQKLDVSVNGNRLSANADSTGHWAMIMSGGSAPASIEIAGVTYSYPGRAASESGAEIVSNGWRVSRNIGGDAVQTTWFPLNK